MRATVVLLVALSTVVLCLALSGTERIYRLNRSFQHPDEFYLSAYPATPGRHLPTSAHPKIGQLPGVDPNRIFFFSKLIGRGRSRNRFIVNGASPGWVERFSRPPYVNISPEQLPRWREDPQALIINDKLMRKQGWREGQQVTFAVAGATVSGRASIVVPESLNELDKIIMHSDHLESQLPPPLRGQAVYVSFAVDRDHHREVGRSIEAVYEQVGEPAWVFTSEETTDYMIRNSSQLAALWRSVVMLLLCCGLVSASALGIARRNAQGDPGGPGRPSRFRRSCAIWSAGGFLGALLGLSLFHRSGLALGSWILENVTVSWSASLAGFLGMIAIGTATTVLFSIGYRIADRAAGRLAMRTLTFLAVTSIAAAGGTATRSLGKRDGLTATITRSGRPELFVVTSPGPEHRSRIPLPVASAIAQGIAADAPGEHKISLELVTHVERRGSDRKISDLIVRGVDPRSLELHGAVIEEGALPAPGTPGLLVGARRRTELPPGRKLRVGRRWWPVVGSFSAPGTALDSELWCDREALMKELEADTVSSVYGTGLDAHLRAQLSKIVEKSSLSILPTRSYSAELARSSLETRPPWILFLPILGLAIAGAAMMANALHARFTRAAQRLPRGEQATLARRLSARAAIWTLASGAAGGLLSPILFPFHHDQSLGLVYAHHLSNAAILIALGGLGAVAALVLLVSRGVLRAHL